VLISETQIATPAETVSTLVNKIDRQTQEIVALKALANAAIKK
jgi:hypothetical protein